MRTQVYAVGQEGALVVADLHEHLEVLLLSGPILLDGA